MKSGFRYWYDASLKFIYYTALLLLPVMLFYSETSEDNPIIQADISMVNGHIDTLYNFPHATVLSAGKISMKGSSTSMKYFAPRTYADPVYLIFFFLCAVVIIVFFGNFSYKHPFTNRALIGLYIGCGLIILFYIINFSRYDWFNHQVEQLTNGQFTYNKPFPLASPEFWIFFILIRVIRIYRKGLALQSDADLTV